MSAAQSPQQFAALGVGNPYAVTVTNFGGPQSTPSAIVGGSQYALLSSGFHTLLGYSLQEATGNNYATLTFYDGASATPSTTHYGQITLAPNQTVRESFANIGGWTGSSGQLCISVASGWVSGAVLTQ